MSIHCFSILSFFFLVLYALPFTAQGVVPSSQTFTLVNKGEFGDYIVEYDANYRPVFSSPFQLCFYNTTPGAYTLALRMGTVRSESLMRWVWEANRGNPVGENATFALCSNGNLVLSNADGRKVWQSSTIDKDVVGFKLLPNGNMVLYDSKGNFVWQSFDYPTDTLLVGQSLRLKGPNKLVSRLSITENKNGPYSLGLEPNRFALYYKSKNSPNAMLYFDSTNYLGFRNVTLDVITFHSGPETDDAFAYELRLDINLGSRILSRPKYNSTLTYLRLGLDGGLRAFTFYDKVDYGAWEESFTLFPRASGDECGLPERCGDFGLCEESQCVGCPSPNGLLGWTENCRPPKLKSCKANEIKYYKLEGVDHFISKYTRGNGPMKEEECLRNCTIDCKCLGFFFNRAEAKCWIVYDLKTLRKVENSTHVGYIKAPLH